MPFAELNVLKTHVYFFKPQFGNGAWLRGGGCAGRGNCAIILTSNCCRSGGGQRRRGRRQEKQGGGRRETIARSDANGGQGSHGLLPGRECAASIVSEGRHSRQGLERRPRPIPWNSRGAKHSRHSHPAPRVPPCEQRVREKD